MGGYTLRLASPVRADLLLASLQHAGPIRELCERLREFEALDDPAAMGEKLNHPIYGNLSVYRVPLITFPPLTFQFSVFHEVDGRLREIRVKQIAILRNGGLMAIA